MKSILPFDLVFHPVDQTPGAPPSDCFAEAIRQVLNAADGEICLVSPYLTQGVIAAVVAGRDFRLVTDLDACFDRGDDGTLYNFLREHQANVRDLTKVHAKVVLSEKAALIGSANLTTSGLAGRDEMGCIVRDEVLLGKLRGWFEALYEVGRTVEENTIAGAADRGRKSAASQRRAQAHDDRGPSRPGRSLGWMTKRRAGDALPTPSGPSPASTLLGSPSPSTAPGSLAAPGEHVFKFDGYTMKIAEPVRGYRIGWADYYRLVLAQEIRPLVRIRETPGQASYLGDVRVAQDLFAARRTLANMTVEERWKVFLPHKDIPYYGMVLVPRTFGELARDEPAQLDAALDEIPATGDVSRASFERFVKNLPKRATGIVSSTRLLAMKRPDRFLCLDSSMRSLVGRSFDVEQKKLARFDGYWTLVNRIWECPWASSDGPSHGDELEVAVWRARVAIMDAFGFGLGSMSEDDATVIE